MFKLTERGLIADTGMTNTIDFKKDFKACLQHKYVCQLLLQCYVLRNGLMMKSHILTYNKRMSPVFLTENVYFTTKIPPEDHF